MEFHYIYLGNTPSESSLLEICLVESTSKIISVQCTYSNPVVTGFQMIAQLNRRQVQKIYTSKTINRQIPASVVVEDNGMYQVTVFAIRGESGIVDSDVEFRERVLVINSSQGNNKSHSSYPIK